MAGQRQNVKRRDFLKAAGAGLAVGPFFHIRPAKADKGELVVVSWGGPWNEALRNVMFRDFEAETGIRVRDDAPPENAKIKAMVESGNVTWDVIDTDMPAILSLIDDNLLEPIDYAKIDQKKLANIPKNLHHPYAIGHKIYSFNICYNTDIFPKGQHPKTWADVWDGDKFPGGRTFNFRGGVSPQLEIALLADGVPMDQLYPLDVERGWRSFDRLRPLVTKWYGSHSEAIQLLSSGEVAVGCTIGAETITAKRQGTPVDVEYNQGKLSWDNWSIVKGTQNLDAAHEYINFALDGKRQAEMSKYVPYGFSNSDAANYLTPEEAADLCSSPENLKKQFWWNVEWWGALGEDGKTPRERLAEEYAAWMVKG